jgi:sugar O-acyltransferase (sialic acid O-acetyltransferase NeuD family)
MRERYTRDWLISQVVLDNKKKKEIVIIGSGGHASSVIDILQQLNEWNIYGVVSVDIKKSESFQGIIVLGDDTVFEGLLHKQYAFVIAVGQILSSLTRVIIFNQLLELKATLPVIISPDAYIAANATIGIGTMIFHRVVINANVQIGNNCIVNNMSLIEHDTIIGSHSHISTGAIVNGNVRIGEHCFIGSGAVIANNIRICNSVIIGAGAVVVSDINSPGIYFGNPSRKKSID